jgi:hypothetical protein
MLAVNVLRRDTALAEHLQRAPRSSGATVLKRA